MIAEITLPSVTADSSTAAAAYIDVAIGFPIPAGYTILVIEPCSSSCKHGLRAVVIGGDY